MSTTQYTYGVRYREETELRDGTRVALRLLRPEDRDLLRRGFQQLSSESRYNRFMSVKPSITEAELALLTELDGEDRFALGAIREAGDDGEPEGLGIARFARLPDDPEVAEAAVTVVDEVQGQGLGSLLLRRLSAAAWERGVRYFRGEVLIRNERMQRLLESHADARVVTRGDGTVQVLVALPPSDEGEEGERLGELLLRLLEQAARGSMTMRLGDVLLKRR